MVRIAYFGTDGCPGHHVIPIRGKFTEEDIKVILKGYEGKPLCSECAAIEYDKEDQLVVVPGTWHGKFKKEWPTEEEKKHIGKNGILNY